jgi:hypothetical protein
MSSRRCQTNADGAARLAGKALTSSIASEEAWRCECDREREDRHETGEARRYTFIWALLSSSMGRADGVGTLVVSSGAAQPPMLRLTQLLLGEGYWRSVTTRCRLGDLSIYEYNDLGGGAECWHD